MTHSLVWRDACALKNVHRLLFLPALLSSVFAPILNAQVQPAQGASSTMTTMIAALGGTPPSDSVATATVDVTAGSTRESGTMRIITWGTKQTLEEVNLPSGMQQRFFSQGDFPDGRRGIKHPTFEESLSGQSPMFPLPWLQANATSADVLVEDLGIDSLAGVSWKHLRLTNTFQSNKALQRYSRFTTKDLWVDPSSGLPAKVSFEQRSGSGAVAGVPIAIEYSDYRRVQGFLYPFHIRKFVNGTLWVDIAVQSVTFNSGVSSASFSTK